MVSTVMSQDRCCHANMVGHIHTPFTGCFHSCCDHQRFLKSSSIISSFVAASHIFLWGSKQTSMFVINSVKQLKKHTLLQTVHGNDAVSHVCVLECFKGFTEEYEGHGDDVSSEKLSTAKNLEMNWLAEN